VKFKPEKISGLNGIQTHDLFDTGIAEVMGLGCGFVFITATINLVFSFYLARYFVIPSCVYNLGNLHQFELKLINPTGIV